MPDTWSPSRGHGWSATGMIARCDRTAFLTPLAVGIRGDKRVAITEFFHLIHVVDDKDEVDAWYNTMFAPKPFITKSWMRPGKAMRVALIDR